MTELIGDVAAGDAPSRQAMGQRREVSAELRETLEDYTLRFAPRSYRKWGPAVVASSALGGIAYLADFAIGANIGMAHGTGNALWGILIFAVVVVITGYPLAYYARDATSTSI